MQKLGMKNHFIAGEPRHNLAAGSNYIQADVPQLAMLICKAKADPRSPISLRISRTGEAQLLRLESFKCFLMSPSFNSEIRLSIETNAKDHNR